MQGKTILIVEDEVLVARDLKQMLERAGYIVPGHAISSDEAIQLAEKFKPDAIMMDIHLHGPLDGIETSKRIRSFHDTPIIYLTAHSDRDTIARMTKTDPALYLTKPYQENELIVNIDIAINKHIFAKKLKENEARLSTILKSITDPVIVSDPDGHIRFINSALEQLTGWKNSEIVDKHVHDQLAFKDSKGQILNNVHPTLQTIEKKEIIFLDETVHISTKDNRLLPVDVSSIPILDSDNNILGTILAIRDSTKSQVMKQQLLAMTEELKRSKERAAELESFSYTISHDLRAPLRSIDGFSQILMEEFSNKLPEKSLEHLHRVRNATKRMDNLISGILNLSQFTKRDLKFETVDLSTMAEEISQELRMNNHSPSIQIIIEKGLTAKVDKILFGSVLQNLIANAWKFSSKKANPKIEIGLLKKTADESIFFVRDNGVGFDMKGANKLFEVFERLHKPEDFPGTGIGLATVKKIISKHGGKIWVQSEVDKETTFYFSIPNRDETSISQ